MHFDNRKRALSEVVSLDAWHEGFSQKKDRVNLHVDVAFTLGRIGDLGDDIRFKLHLKRAEVVVVVPTTEPAKIDKSSVVRNTPDADVEKKTVSKSKRQISGKARFGGKGGVDGIIPSIDIGGQASAQRAQEQATHVMERMKTLRVLQSQTADGDYVWQVESSTGRPLEGHPWDAKREPRLKVIDKRSDRTKGIEPNIRVEVRCRREDLEIKDIKLVNEDAWRSLLTDPLRKNKMATAEAIIRTRLFQSGLLSGDISDPYAQMTISVVIAEGQ